MAKTKTITATGHKEAITGPPEEYVLGAWTCLALSNQGGSLGGIYPQMAARLKSEPLVARHAAWNFNGQVWWQDGAFHEMVDRHHESIAQYTAPTLEALMRLVNSRHGWD